MRVHRAREMVEVAGESAVGEDARSERADYLGGVLGIPLRMARRRRSVVSALACRGDVW